MDKKKLLLVAVSVGIFLIIVIGLSIVLFLPRRNASIASSKSLPVFTQSNNAVNPSAEVPVEPESLEPLQTEPASANPVDMLRNPEGIQSLQTPPPTPVSTMTQENNIYIYGDPAQAKTVVEQLTQNKSSDLVIEVPKPSAVAVPSTTSSTWIPPQNPTPVPATERVAPRAPQRTTPTVSTPAPAPTAAPPRAAAKPPASKTPVARAPTAAATTAQNRTYEDYWVQAGAFSTAVRAEEAKKDLAGRGITAIIENRDVNGQNFYRVRVGPFTSQNEADYWLSVIKKIQGFEQSQIRQRPVD